MPRRKSYSWYDRYGYERDEFEPSKPIQRDDGLKARSQRGAFAKNWWAEKWIAALERLVDPGRLSRGRSYARRGQVLSIDEVRDGVEARVQGSQRKPYRVRIQVEPLSGSQWDGVIDALAEQALFTAQLLAGEMPPDIETAFQAAGVSLFPAREGDLTTNCSCPDWANPCKHVAATHYILGERFDEDPFLLFRLRGHSQEQVIQELRGRRAAWAEAEEGDEEAAEEIIPLEGTLDHFWDAGMPLHEVAIHLKPPAVEMPLLKRLGDPGFIAEPGLQALLRPVYETISRSALEAALSGDVPFEREDSRKVEDGSPNRID
jgi:uncharacterized Zn finger protein